MATNPDRTPFLPLDTVRATAVKLAKCNTAQKNVKRNFRSASVKKKNEDHTRGNKGWWTRGESNP